MGMVTTVGLDIAKSVFQVHGIDAVGTVLVRRRLSRARVLEFFEKLPPCLVGIEACQHLAFLGSHTHRAGPRCPAHAGAVRETLRQARQERRCRCRSNLRSGDTSHHEVRCSQKP